MTRIRIIFTLLLLAALLLAAGCVNPPQKTAAPDSTAAPATDDLAGGSALPATQAVSPAATLTETTIAVPAKVVTSPREIKNPDYIKMDAENYKVGEIVEFKLINRGTTTIHCSTTDPGYSVSLLSGDGTPSVVARSGGTSPVITGIPPSTPTRTYTLNTVNLTPGKYLIEFDCEKGIAREFVLDENLK
ncbi:MAG: hypothetical protein WC379_01850 [Methanoregula sp.]|jgi:hypothetical protein